MRVKNFSIISLVIIIINCQLINSQVKVFDAIVSADGSGNYMFIKTALDYNKKLIFIKNGVYKEKISVDASKTNIRLIGENKESSIITNDDYVGKNSSIISTYDTYTLKISSNGFYAENLTIENTATQAQAVALLVEADTVVFKNCIIKGFQDSHYAKSGRHFYYNCIIMGDVDFIFGNATAYFENCTIVSRNRKPGYITAPGQPYIKTTKLDNTTLLHGFVFKNCYITYENGLPLNSTYLGRPWEDYSSSVFINCRIDAHIRPEGWSVWTTDISDDGCDNHLTSFFAEYKSKDIYGNLLNVSNRVDWSNQIPDADTIYFTEEYFLKGWNPFNKLKYINYPSNIFIENDTLKWENINDARGYIIYRNDSIVSITSLSYFPIKGKTGVYKIRTVSSFGSISDFSLPFTISKINDYIIQNKYIILQNQIVVDEKADITIFDVTGKIVFRSIINNSLNLNFLKKGIYIIQLKFDKYIINKKFIKA